MSNFYTIVKATPLVTPRIAQEFFDTFNALEPGEAFSFPVNPDLKDPLASFRHHGRQHAPEGSRYRWVLSADLIGAPIGTVYRTR